MRCWTVGEVVALFADMTPPLWGTPGKAANNCGTASPYFASFLQAHGLSAEVVSLFGRPAFVVAAYAQRGDPLQDGEQAHHVVVSCQGHYYDWTRRQYDPAADYPHVSTRAELEAEGWTLHGVSPESQQLILPGTGNG